MFAIIFELIFPLALIGILIIIFIKGIFTKAEKRDYMTLDEFIKDWIRDHGVEHKLEPYFESMKKNPAGKLYMPITYKWGKFFSKLGISANEVSIINLTLSFLGFYGVIMAGRGHLLNYLIQQPAFGSWFILLGIIFLVAGIIDGADGAIARLENTKSASGAWFDNNIDRISDILMLVCLIPGGISIIPDYNYNFKWLVWTNILIIFIYEYMRARHQGLGLHALQPTIGERITRIIILSTFFFIYGISSFSVFITYLINPALTSIWSISHRAIINWVMVVHQVILLLVMVISVIRSIIFAWKNLKKIDESENNN